MDLQGLAGTGRSGQQHGAGSVVTPELGAQRPSHHLQLGRIPVGLHNIGTDQLVRTAQWTQSLNVRGSQLRWTNRACMQTKTPPTIAIMVFCAVSTNLHEVGLRALCPPTKTRCLLWTGRCLDCLQVT